MNLEAGDVCYCIWEYTAAADYTFSPANQLISNLKIKPTQIVGNPLRARYKREAMRHCAAALRCLIRPAWAEVYGTFVPMPGSKTPEHRDHDDRIDWLLRAAFAGLNADIRPMLVQTASTLADHETEDRLSYNELHRLMHLSTSHLADPPRANIAIVDDVLSSGKHFKVAQAHLSRRFPGVPVTGIFIARCVRRT
jgi:predicted amidophosphoribosyltransferase